MNRPTSHPEQRLLLVRVSDTNYDENTKLIVTILNSLRRQEDANNNNSSLSTSPPSSSDSTTNITTHTVNIQLDDVIKFFDENPTSFIFTQGPEPIRHVLIPLFVRNDQYVPHQLLTYYDICELSTEYSDNDLESARLILELNEEKLEKIQKVISIDYKPAPITEEIQVGSDGDNVIVRARGLPWQASDQHVAQFFAGLDIVAGGIALCLSSEGRRNGEVLVQFASQESRDLALKRHRNFLLSRYIEVYKATIEEFLHVASGSSTEAMEFVSANASIVRMRGLPYDCSDTQIRNFFEPLKLMDKILFISRSDGRPTGDAFVQLETEEEAQQALLKHRQTIGQRYIELFKSTAAEVQQVVKKCNQINCSSASANNGQVTGSGGSVGSVEQYDEKKKDCVRLRGLPYEAQVQHIVTFLGDYAKMVKYQGVHMIYNNQGHPSGEAFIQMCNEQAAAATALGVHNKFMVIGKKQRYIEVFQCSPEDLNLQHLVKTPPLQTAPPNLGFLPQPMLTQQQQAQFWSSYPSPPISPIIGGLSQLVIYGIGMNIGVPELVAQFSSQDVIVENVIFTRWPSPINTGEAIITLRNRQTAPPPPLAHLANFPYHQQHQHQPHQQQFIPQPIMME